MLIIDRHVPAIYRLHFLICECNRVHIIPFYLFVFHVGPIQQSDAGCYVESMMISS